MGLKILVPAKSSLEREILPGRILSPRKDWKDSGRNLQIPPVASGNYRLLHVAQVSWLGSYTKLTPTTFQRLPKTPNDFYSYKHTLLLAPNDFQ